MYNHYLNMHSQPQGWIPTEKSQVAISFLIRESHQEGVSYMPL